MATKGRKKRAARFYEKEVRFFFSNFIGPVTSIWVLSLLETLHMDFTERILARPVFARSMKGIGWKLGA